MNANARATTTANARKPNVPPQPRKVRSTSTSAPDIKPLTKTQQNKVDSYQQTSSKIRYLASEGYSTSEIASHLGILYQHVRNVLITPVETPRNK